MSNRNSKPSSRLTNDKKTHNSMIKTGTDVLRSRISKLEETLSDLLERGVQIRSRSDHEIPKTRVLTMNNNIKIVSHLIKQLKECTNILESQKIK